MRAERLEKVGCAFLANEPAGARARLAYADDDRDGKIDIVRNGTDVDGDADLKHEIIQEKNYYAFGLQHKGYNNIITGRDHKYGFGGKEYQDELNLAWYDVSARNYDAALGRWMNIDPLAEQMRRHSPYNFGFDNPVYFQDYDGMKPSGTNCEKCDKDKKKKEEKRTNIDQKVVGAIEDFGNAILELGKSLFSSESIKARAKKGTGTLGVGVQFWVDSKEQKMGDGDVASSTEGTTVYDQNASGVVALLDSRTGLETNSLVDNTMTITGVDEKGKAGAKALGTSYQEQMVTQVHTFEWSSNGYFDVVDLETTKDTVIYQKDLKTVNATDSKKGSENLKKQVNIWDQYERTQDSLTQAVK